MAKDHTLSPSYFWTPDNADRPTKSKQISGDWKQPFGHRLYIQLINFTSVFFVLQNKEINKEQIRNKKRKKLGTKKKQNQEKK